MKKIKMAAALTLSAAMVLSLAACGSTAKETAAATTAAGGAAESGAAGESKGTITFGVVTPLTGTHQEYGIGCEAAVKIAIDEINAAGGVNGYTLAYEVQDSASDSTASSDIVRGYAENDDIYAIIGDFTSSCCMADATIIDEYGIIQLSPTASNPAYPGMSTYAFTVMNNQSSESPWFGRAVVGEYLGAKSAAIMYLNTDWGNVTYGYIVEGLEAGGVELTASESYAETETDFSSVISKMKASDPEVLIVLDQGNVPTIVNQIRGTGWDVKIATLGPGCSEQIIELCGENAEGLVVDTPSFLTVESEDDRIVDLCTKFLDATGYAMTDHSLCAYNAVQMLRVAIENIGDGEVTRDTLRDALADAEYDGFAGKVSFTEEGGVNREYLITEIEGGKYVIKEDYGYGVE